MTYFTTIINLIFIMNSMLIFDFQKDSNISHWRTVNDDVMGGISNSKFYVNDSGDGIFEGHVSLENNGGFAMVMYSFKSKDVRNYNKAIIRVKGDGKKYQFRIKSNTSDYFSYISHFDTTGEWQTVEINLKEMYPSFRGRKLDKPNYPSIQVEQIAFLIGNKKEENFILEIDKIEFK
ncbi:CIA30 family protein [Yeosuana sp. MJ-SS3]|uniref:CIA30 family protein n=1 Tax=Gilvirhabdus luticola TaxID=3079858 RepID=A0ABU3U770_9FLAO|nr:CIA30 family protein [Yeosuana sp. MJ-SS3]MDU8886248.1 CIA30 family protein [Yeosuana sp. MJ-SS3]